MKNVEKNLLFTSFKEEALKNATFRAEYEKLRPEFELIRKLIIARKNDHPRKRSSKNDF